MMRWVSAAGRIALLTFLLAVPGRAQVQQGSPVDDLLTAAQNAYNDLEYSRAETLARQVLGMTVGVNEAQRDRALMIIAAAAFPDDPSVRPRQDVALDALRQLVRRNLTFTMPIELTWPGLNALVDEAKRTTFAVVLSADSAQVVVGPEGRAGLRVRSNRAGRYRLAIVQGDAAPLVLDSAASDASNVAEFRFPTMRDGKPLFSSGSYTAIVTGVDAGNGGDTVVVRGTLMVDAPPMDLIDLSVRMDSTKLLPEHSGRAGAKAIFPGLLVGAAAFILASGLRGEGDLATEVGPDSRGVAVAGVLAISTIVAGFMDRGRPIPANIEANRAYGVAFQEALAAARTENDRRVSQYRTTVRFVQEAR